ncbi:hypothetical protein Tco_0077620 [Tanacetum coccineum]
MENKVTGGDLNLTSLEGVVGEDALVILKPESRLLYQDIKMKSWMANNFSVRVSLVTEGMDDYEESKRKVENLED